MTAEQARECLDLDDTTGSLRIYGVQYHDLMRTLEIVTRTVI